MARGRGRLFLFPESSCRADTRGGWNVLGPGRRSCRPLARRPSGIPARAGRRVTVALGHTRLPSLPRAEASQEAGWRAEGKNTLLLMKWRFHSAIASRRFHLQSVSGHEGRVWSRHVGLPLVKEGRITLAFLAASLRSSGSGSIGLAKKMLWKNPIFGVMDLFLNLWKLWAHLEKNTHEHTCRICFHNTPEIFMQFLDSWNPTQKRVAWYNSGQPGTLNFRYKPVLSISLSQI